ncbi:MAG: acyl--CoA ligase [Treponema sp.]|jgi:acyl-coenzyme A synthetase/AMP-(fatty) acid ligase|nr:acyl--CoA ligase [Treponema sp.]
MTQFNKISTFCADSYPMDHVVCFEGIWSENRHFTWRQFLENCAKLRRVFTGNPAEKWLLHCKDRWYFLAAYIALLQCGKEVLLTASTAPLYIEELRSGGAEFACDQDAVKKTVDIKKILEDDYKNNPVTETELRTCPPICAERTRIHMFTSGTTGTPKDVVQRLTELETENEFLYHLWRQFLTGKKLIATVSQHHNYGLVDTIQTPFAAGIPICRFSIEFPEEFEKYSDTSYFIVTVPAFLKRTVCSVERLPMKNPFILTAGGVLTRDVAEATESIFGVWPHEIYGSTEANAIGYRLSKASEAWTPVCNGSVSLADDGCLLVRSPLIVNPEGLNTGDLAEIFPDGSFILKGRANSIVKIEGKRISLPEVEKRLSLSGLISDSCVIAISDRREYLAAVIVLNRDGHKKFDGYDVSVKNRFFHDFLLQYFENVVIPKKWRYPAEIPVNQQGKRLDEKIRNLFTKKGTGVQSV